MGQLNNILTGFFEVINSTIMNLGVTDTGIAYVLGIAVYTLILKTIILPLYIYQQKSSIGMSKVSPRMKEIQEKYKNNPQKMQEEQLKLYKEMGVNPFKGCLPVLVQLPIFAAMFYVISGFEGFNGVSFLWIKDLAKPDPIYVLPVMTAVMQFLSTKIMSRNMEEEQRKMQSKMAIGMSIFFLFICINYKAALAIYFISSSIIQTVQSLVINGYLRNKQEKEDAIREAEEKERKEREAKEKAARREEYKKKKKKKRIESSEATSKDVNVDERPKKKVKKKIKDDNVVE